MEQINKMSKDFLLEALTRWSYFPTQKKENEYTPALHSKKFTPEVSLELTYIDFPKDRKQKYDQVEFSLTRHNSTTRLLSIPHPLPYSKLCNTVANSLEQINLKMDIYNNVNSLIKPHKNESGKLVVMDYEDPLEKSERLLDHSFGKKFRVQTDISNCFPSIYTHAIPWALVGFEHAKEFRGNAEWYNQIDEGFRNIRRGETQGIGIGPAISNFAAEIILTRIDESLSKKFDYTRYIDDYTCYCETHEKALEFLNTLESQLKKFKLTINTRKTTIKELPATIHNEWLIELQSRSPIGYLNKHDDEILSFKHSALEAIKHIELAVHLNSKEPDGSIIKYAVKMILGRLDNTANEPVIHYLLNLSFIYPHLLPLLEELLEQPNVDPKKYELHLNKIAATNAKLGRSDGMCWPLYYLHKHNLTLDPNVIAAIIQAEDCTAILLIEHFEDHHGCSAAFLSTLQPGYDQDKYWLLIYQLLHWDRLDKKFITPEYQTMMKHQVSFSYLDNKNSESEDKLETEKIRKIFESVPLFVPAPALVSAPPNIIKPY
ncbi:antiviral reverse transcriptase Drt4 [Pseudomonas brassicacearum]|uniref:Reverse transcriptase domain-containing protein n=1 Tax=Pseudomonas brassicacearum TaxID=930166 RepID=A0A423GKN1_9PSED|nr:antiviral reverse transcriptase Drt4 [Pseudomonas brassicacearum]ROM91072.1 hypothetical protein BK658_24550 [Pseudomonas brassicacearum]